MTALELFSRLLRVPQRGTRRLGPVTLYPEQQRLVEAWDAIGADGRPLYDELVCYWGKKSGKSTTVAGLTLHELVSGRESDREILLVSRDLDQSRDIVFATIARFVSRDPWLREHITVGKTEIRYVETVTDSRTGGRHTETHIIRALAGGSNADSLHGSNATLTVFDELWAFPNYDVIEALGRSPARECPRVLYASYAGLRSQQRIGVPLWDLHTRWKANTDPSLFVSYIGGPDGWRAVPWLTEAFMAKERRRFEAVPSKFVRLYENTWSSGDEGTFLSAAEITDATDTTIPTEPQPVAGTKYSIGADLGLTHDLSAVVLSHVDADGRVAVDAVRSWRGTKAKPVDLADVESVIVAWAQRFRADVHLDQWQGVYIAQRLARLSLTATTHTIESSKLDNYASLLKTLFKNRHVRVPADPTLIEQLETIEGQELSRRDRVRFTSGVGGHDDTVMALCLSIETFAKTVRDANGTVRLAFRIGHIGLKRMADITYCRAAQATTKPDVRCPLTIGYSAEIGCLKCAAYTSAKEAQAAHEANGGAFMSLRGFIQLHMVPCAFIRDQAFNYHLNRLAI